MEEVIGLLVLDEAEHRGDDDGGQRHVRRVAEERGQEEQHH